MRLWKTRDEGFVSLLTSILISLLLLIVTVSMVTLETLQLRKASDAEQSLRAYYAAEAGVEDAVAKILSNPTNRTNQACTSNTNYDIPGAAGWTCQQISFSGTPFGRLDRPDQAKTIDPGTTTPNYQSILVEWDQSTVGAAGYYNAPGSLPSQAGYNASPFAAPIELSIVQYPRTTFASNNPNLRLQNALIVPGGAAAGALVNYNAAGFATGSPYRGNCAPNRASNPYYPQTNYRCYAVVSGFNGGLNYLFRIRSRYAASAFRFTFYTGNNATGAVVQVPDGTATIDVTARAGQTYRRTISKLPLNSSASSGLNYVMYSDTNICKNFEVIDNTFPAGGPC
jgi:Tfp pilus assembly protein PilX